MAMLVVGKGMDFEKGPNLSWWESVYFINKAIPSNYQTWARPGAALQTHPWFIHRLINWWFVKISLRRRHALIVEDGAFSHKIYKLHYWFKSYCDFAEWVDFAHWWSFSGEGSASAACVTGLFSLHKDGWLFSGLRSLTMSKCVWRLTRLLWSTELVQCSQIWSALYFSAVHCNMVHCGTGLWSVV